MRILVAGATGSIGIHVVNTAIAMGHQPVTLVRNRRKIKLLPRGTDKLSSMIISCIWLSTTLTIRKRRRCLRRRTASASASIRPFCRSFIRLRSVKSYIQTWKACKWIWTSGCGITIMSELIREKCAVGVRQWKRYLMENASGPRKI